MNKRLTYEPLPKKTDTKKKAPPKIMLKKRGSPSGIPDVPKMDPIQTIKKLRCSTPWF
jgi:hypothetical protein